MVVATGHWACVRWLCAYVPPGHRRHPAVAVLIPSPAASCQYLKNPGLASQRRESPFLVTERRGRPVYREPSIFHVAYSLGYFLEPVPAWRGYFSFLLQIQGAGFRESPWSLLLVRQ